MASTSGSGASATPYDVFLSFRGPDTRNTFTDCLYRTMVGQGIVAYRDSEDLHAGDRIDDLLTAVGDSKICIPVLSTGYASSAWCLRELARVTELNESTGKPEILPIFFDVTPSDVKLRTELYVKDLEKHERRHGGQIRQQWEAALRKVAEIKGWEVQGNPHGEVIDLVVKEVLPKLRVRQRPLDSKLVGVDGQAEAIMKLLDVESGTGVHFVGIYGMGGIGKTTLAKIVFNELCPRFDGQCSFIGNIRESSKGNGLVDLQKKVASDIFGSRFVENFTDADEAIDSLRRRAGAKKVLIVLDDLDKKEQFKKLVGGLDTFGSGSKIIITTRDKRILDEEDGILAYELKQMDCDKALELFSLHAFSSVSPPDTHKSISREVVSTTGGLPLALEVIGSYLRHQNEDIWREMLKKLKKVPTDEVLDKLKISYDTLRDAEKEIFLDIACFFINEEKSRATYFWDACDLCPHRSLKKLTDLCLIKIDSGDAIWMHDQLRDLGRDIVRQECTENLTGCRRSWDDEEALKVVRSKERKDKVQALNLVGHRSGSISIVDKELERMPNLKFLKLSEGTFVGDIHHYLLELRWLSWDSPPPHRRMANLHMKNLVVFKLSNNKYTKNWNILKTANKLKVLSLSRCEGLKRIPNLSGSLSLERLTLHGCPKLREVDSSIGKLKALTHLNIIWCQRLQTLPEEIGGLVNMKHFSIRDCHNMKKLPYSIWKLASLSTLNISNSKIASLPDSIGNAKRLLILDLSWTPIVELPISIGELTQLESLYLNGCRGLQGLPVSIGNLTSLQKLDLSMTNIVELPDSIKYLKQLKVLNMVFSALRRLPTSIGMLERLEELDVRDCQQLGGELPAEIGKLSFLSILSISARVCAVLAAIKSLTRLQKLYLLDCNELQELPKLPSSLEILHVRSASLRLVPDLSYLTNLVKLILCNGSRQAPTQTSDPMQTLQLQWVGKLSKLEDLSWQLSDVPMPSTEVGCLTRLRALTFSSVDSFNSVVVGPQFSNWKNLSRLGLYHSPLREIQLDGLELLRDLGVEDCKFLEKLSIIPSSLRKLCGMRVGSCPKLLEIQFLGAMESLKELEVGSCGSLGGLWGLSNLKKLEQLWIGGYNELQVVEGLEELELLRDLCFVGCGSLERWTDVFNPKIPNECWIHIRRCAKLSSFHGTYRDYREMTLRRTRIRSIFNVCSWSFR